MGVWVASRSWHPGHGLQSFTIPLCLEADVDTGGGGGSACILLFLPYIRTFIDSTFNIFMNKKAKGLL